MLQPNPLFNWPSKPTYPYGPMSPMTGMPSSLYGNIQPQHHNNLQSMSQTNSPSSQSLSTAQSQTQQQVALSNNSPAHPSSIPHTVLTVTPPSITATTNVGNSVPNNNPSMINTNSISEPLTSEIHLPTTAPAQFTPTAQFYNTNSNNGNNAPLRQMQYLPDPGNLQYYTNVAPVPVQQVQFVPCMCPVTMGVAPELIANKRSDDMSVPVEFQEQFSRAEPPPAQHNIPSTGATAAVTIDEQQH